MKTAMLLSRVISASLWTVGLIASVSSNTDNPDWYENWRYGKCGKPAVTVPHGGIKFFPVGGQVTNPKENMCYGCYPACLPCELTFYCDDGYKYKGAFDFKCELNITSITNAKENKWMWTGTIPTCEEITLSDTLVRILPGVLFPVTLMVIVVLFACRSHNASNRPTNGQGIGRRGFRPNLTTIRINPSSWMPTGERTPRLMANTGSTGYSRLDDSNVEVPPDDSPPTTSTTTTSTNSNAVETPTIDACGDPPPYTMVQLNAFTQEDTHEVGLDPPDSAPATHKTSEERAEEENCIPLQ